MTPQPRVSVVMIFFNALSASLRRPSRPCMPRPTATGSSCWSTTGRANRSTEIALAQAALFAGRVRDVEHAGHANQGMGASESAAVVDQARGRLIAFLDADDTWQPSKLQEQVCDLNGNPVGERGLRVATLLGTAGRDCLRMSVNGTTCRARVSSAKRLYEPPELLLLTAPLGTAPCRARRTFWFIGMPPSCRGVRSPFPRRL